MIDKDILSAVLEAREERVDRRNELISEYEKPVITVSLNIPGPKKSEECYEAVFNILWNLLTDRLKKEHIKIEYSLRNKTALGYEGFIVADSDGSKLKLAGLSLEKEHPLGVLFDIDVTGSDGERVSREEFGYPPRICIVCKKEPAFLCIRGKKHSLNETLKIIHKMIGVHIQHE